MLSGTRGLIKIRVQSRRMSLGVTRGMPYRSKPINWLATVLVGVCLGACAKGGAGDPDSAVTAASGPDMAPIAGGTALPAGYKVDAGRTIIFGTDESWTGRLS